MGVHHVSVEVFGLTEVLQVGLLSWEGGRWIESPAMLPTRTLVCRGISLQETVCREQNKVENNWFISVNDYKTIRHNFDEQEIKIIASTVGVTE